MRFLILAMAVSLLSGCMIPADPPVCSFLMENPRWDKPKSINVFEVRYQQENPLELEGKTGFIDWAEGGWLSINHYDPTTGTCNRVVEAAKYRYVK